MVNHPGKCVPLLTVMLSLNVFVDHMKEEKKEGKKIGAIYDKGLALFTEKLFNYHIFLLTELSLPEVVPPITWPHLRRPLSNPFTVFISNKAMNKQKGQRQHCQESYIHSQWAKVFHTHQPINNHWRQGVLSLLLDDETGAGVD